MRQIFWISVFVFTLILSNNTNAQLVWQENFDVPDKGVWANSAGNIVVDTADIGWTINADSCIFSDESDYAKTVTTNGGRFEVLDSDGEVLWISALIPIADYDFVNISLFASETGGSSAEDKKYINAYYIVDGGEEIPFSPVSGYSGNWGGGDLTQKSLHGETLQIAVRLNSSYANDKVFIDNVKVEAVDSTTLIPSYLKIIETPLFAFSGDSVKISAAIYNLNDDILIDTTLQLLFDAPDFETANASFNDGVYSWRTLTTKNGEFRYSIYIAGWNLDAVDSTIIFFTKDDAKLIHDFEDSTYQNWELNTDWLVSNVEPIAGMYSMKHSESALSNPSVLIYDADAFKLAEEEYFFSFKIKNGNWDPSSSNSFYLYMNAEESVTPSTGYAIGVNAVGSSDMVSFWKVNNGEPTELIAETNFDWNENTTAQFNIIRNPWGEWILNVSDLTNGNSSSVNFLDKEFPKIYNFQLFFEYTASRIGLLWFDDFIIIGQNAAPFISDVKVLDNGKFQVVFNEDVLWDGISTSSFVFTDSAGHFYGVQQVEKQNENTAVVTTVSITEPNIIVTARNITDLDDKTTLETVFEFENALPAIESDIVITEIMADPNPPLSLPDAEYIEIYNRSDKYIQLEGWTLFVRNSDWDFPKKLLAPNTYLVLCDKDVESDFNEYGNVLAFDNFPSLLNSGTVISISNTYGQKIEEITYSEVWYFDREKNNGGYSLERIDFNRFCGQRGNWVASNDASGGTPGQKNSVEATNPDNSAPIFNGVEIVSYNQINAIFSEPIDTLSAVSLSNFTIPGETIQRIEYVKGELYVQLVLKSELKPNREYNLLVKNVNDECGIKMEETELPFAIVTLEAGDLIINEVLFNPFTNGSDFVELYNNSGLTIDLANLKLASRDDSLKLKSVYKLSDLHVRFPAGEFFVFTADTANIKSTYYVQHPENIFQVDKFPALNNAEGRVVLLTDSLLVIDEFAYSESMHSDWLTAYDGISLERLSIDDETNSASNWNSASSLIGYATPTYENSQSKVIQGQSVAVKLESDIVSPNGDGYNDELTLTFLLDQSDYVVNVFIFDAAGREVYRLTNNDLIGNMNQVAYDLIDKNGQLLSLGAYVVFSELIHLGGEKKVFKNAFLVTDKY